jgi:hypothetical protein
MRHSIIAAIASFTILAFAPSSQASPLIRGGDLAATAAQNDIQQVRYGYGYHHGYRHYGYRHWHHRHWGYGYGWRHRYYHRHRHWY